MKSWRLLLAICAIWAIANSVHADVPVASCGQEIEGDAYLTGDLDCTGAGNEYGIVMLRGRLDLRGHTLRIDSPTSGEGVTAVYCFNFNLGCGVRSTVPGGHIECLPNAGRTAGISTQGPLRVSDIRISGCDFGMDSYGDNMTLDNSVIEDNQVGIITGHGNVTMSNSQVLNNGQGIDAIRIKLDNVTIQDNADFGLNAVRVKMRDSSVSRNGGNGIQRSPRGTDRIDIRDSVIEDNGNHGIDRGNRVKLKQVTLSGNGGAAVRLVEKLTARDTVIENNRIGIENTCYIKTSRSRIATNALQGVFSGGPQVCGGRLKFRSTVLEQNGHDATCGVSALCGDFVTFEAPPIHTSTSCESSIDSGSTPPGTTWGVCALD